MIVTCSCGAKLKIGDDKLTDAGVRIKCPKCGTPHLVRKPASAGAVPAASPSMPWFASAPAAPSPAPKPESAPAPASSAPPAMPWFAGSPGAQSASPLVLVAHDSKVVVDMIQGVVSEAGLRVEHAPDGLDALKKASSLKPQVMIVDVGLTGIYGFELCERLKGDPDTRGIKIILLSSVYGLTAYKRNPVTLYGADDYIEKHHIPDRLVPKIRELLSGKPSSAQAAAPAAPPAVETGRPAPVTLGTPAAPARPEPKPQPSPPAVTTPPAAAAVQKPAIPDVPDVMPKVPVTLDGTRRLAPAASAIPVAAPPRKEPARQEKQEPDRAAMQDASVKLDAAFFEQDEYEAPVKTPAKVAADPAEVEKARRFARIVVSDIALYNQEAFAEGIAKGTLYELLKDDITEGRALYDKRVPDNIRSSMDYFQEAFDNFIALQKKQR